MSQNVPECPNSDDAILTPDQQIAIALLVTGAPAGDVAASIGVDRRTLYRCRHHDPNFIRALRRQRAELLDNVHDRFHLLLVNALDALKGQLADPYAPTSHRAAKTVLTLAKVGQPMPPRRPTQSQTANRKLQIDKPTPQILPTPTNPDYTPPKT
jgi:hypothetical protein